MPARVCDEAALLIRDLAVREVLRGARVPRIVRDPALAVVMAERDVIKTVGKDRAVQLVLGHGREPLVPDCGREPVGHEDVYVLTRKLNFIECRPVVLDPEPVRDQVEECIADLYLFVPEFVGGSNFRWMIGEDFVG